MQMREVQGILAHMHIREDEYRQVSRLGPGASL